MILENNYLIIENKDEYVPTIDGAHVPKSRHYPASYIKAGNEWSLVRRLKQKREILEAHKTEKIKPDKCPFGNDISNDCENCLMYNVYYHYENGKCVLRKEEGNDA